MAAASPIPASPLSGGASRSTVVSMISASASRDFWVRLTPCLAITAMRAV